jgi:hypothetical protein
VQRTIIYYGKYNLYAYAIGYALAGFTTFMTILGRYTGTGLKIESCCSVLEQQSNKGFLSNMFLTFGYFIKGIKKYYI